MRISKKQLRRIIHEACALDSQDRDMGVARMSEPGPMPGVPSPKDYSAVRGFMQSNPDLVDLGIGLVMDMVGVSCERSTAQAIIDHLQGMVGSGKKDDVMFPEQEKQMQEPVILKIG